MGIAAFIGMSLGNLLSGLFEVFFDRVQIVKYAITFILITGTLSVFTFDIYQLSIIRFMIGFGITVAMPPVLAMLVEFYPTHSRGKLVILIEIIFALGNIYIIIIAILV